MKRGSEVLERRIAVTAEPPALLHSRLGAYPAVAVVGPRQCGKTTLARSLDGRYYDLEQEADRLRLDIEWADVTASDSLLILDEVQASPEVFARLRGAIDADRRRNRRFLLLGSVSPALMMRASESLAGRLSVIELAPLSLGELDAAARARLWLRGGFPDGGVLGEGGFPEWQHDYLNLLAQRDLPSWGLPARPATTGRLFRMLAASHGQQWNASQIGKSLGLSYHTVNRYVDHLEDAFLVRRLPAYHANVRKRLVKRPKMYWRDSGLLHSLMGVGSLDELLGQPWVGSSWEGHVIDQIVTAMQQAGRRFEAWYLRTSDGREIDLVIKVGSELWAVEVKLTTRPGPADMARLGQSADLIGADHRFLVTRRPESTRGRTQTMCDLAGMVAFAAGET